MRLFDLFWKKKSTRRVRKKRKKANTSASRQNIQKIKTNVNNLQAQLGTINILLRKHDEDIAEHSILIEKHTKSIEILEEIVAKQKIIPTTQKIIPTTQKINPSNRPVSTTEPVSPLKLDTQLQSDKLDISRFTPQEKRILSVFFQNQEMALSYADIAQYLNKSPNTIKNQVRQINMKADLFNYTVDNESRKRYKLKDGLKIEKYLNINRPDGSPNRLN